MTAQAMAYHSIAMETFTCVNTMVGNVKMPSTLALWVARTAARNAVRGWCFCSRRVAHWFFAPHGSPQVVAEAD